MYTIHILHSQPMYQPHANTAKQLLSNRWYMLTPCLSVNIQLHVNWLPFFPSLLASPPFSSHNQMSQRTAWVGQSFDNVLYALTNHDSHWFYSTFADINKFLSIYDSLVLSRMCPVSCTYICTLPCVLGYAGLLQPLISPQVVGCITRVDWHPCKD
jgi:hypothetical protein